MATIKVHKLFSIRKNGTIGSLFINKREVILIDVWLDAKEYPTKGFKIRPYFHCTSLPIAPHLTMKNRAWFEVEIDDFIDMNRPKSQGGLWYLAKRMKVIKKI